MLRPGGTFVYTARHTGDAHRGTGSPRGRHLRTRWIRSPHGCRGRLLSALAQGRWGQNGPRSRRCHRGRSPGLRRRARTARRGEEAAAPASRQRPIERTGRHLPRRDEQMVRLERHVKDLVASHGTVEGRKMLHRYATSHLLRRLRRRSRGKEITHYRLASARQHLPAAVHLLDWLEEENLTLPTCRQADLERWMTSDDVRHRRGQDTSCAGPCPRTSPATSASLPSDGTDPPRPWSTRPAGTPPEPAARRHSQA